MLPRLPPYNCVAYHPFISSLNIELLIKHKTLLGTAPQKLVHPRHSYFIISYNLQQCSGIGGGYVAIHCLRVFSLDFLLVIFCYEQPTPKLSKTTIYVWGSSSANQLGSVLWFGLAQLILAGLMSESASNWLTWDGLARSLSGQDDWRTGPRVFHHSAG